MKMTTTRAEELVSALESFQQAAATFAGPYADGQERLLRLAYPKPGVSPTISAEDLDWVRGFMEEMVSNAEHLEHELQSAFESFVESQDSFEADDEEAVYQGGDDRWYFDIGDGVERGPYRNEEAAKVAYEEHEA